MGDSCNLVSGVSLMDLDRFLSPINGWGLGNARRCYRMSSIIGWMLWVLYGTNYTNNDRLRSGLKR